MKRIYLICRKRDLEKCFDCGKICLSLINVENVICGMPCKEKSCPNEKRSVRLGEFKIKNEVYEVWLRVL